MASCVTSRASRGFADLRVLVHQPREQFLIERAPIDADAHRLVVLDRHLDDLRELRIALVLEADIAGIDAVFVERLGAGRDDRPAVCGRCNGSRRPAARVTPSCASRSLMCGTAAAASSRSTVMRTSSEPARASAATWRAVASTSAVSVLVIDCTTIGAPPPTMTPPTSTATDL